MAEERGNEPSGSDKAEKRDVRREMRSVIAQKLCMAPCWAADAIVLDSKWPAEAMMKITARTGYFSTIGDRAAAGRLQGGPLRSA